MEPRQAFANHQGHLVPGVPATRLFAQIFSAPLHEFFDNVLINAENPELRENRMALVSKINRLYTGCLADLSGLSRIDEA